MRELRAHGIRTAVVSSSANAHQVLRAAGLDDAFDAVVDGGEVARLGLRGKPAPDGFLEARAASACARTAPRSWRTRWRASPPAAPATSGS